MIPNSLNIPNTEWKIPDLQYLIIQIDQLFLMTIEMRALMTWKNISH